ncbi:GNAT family N-acetyltransferase [Microvirga sp. GCM10011540]|uniref:GNAT family N-acetyltransferase n=1 Tax=Microvirga sp. GCM10011540 TaxID=3317338 RepID=UPI003623307A
MQAQKRSGSERLRRYVLHHGLFNTFFHLIYRLTNSSVMVLIFRIVTLTRGDVDWSLVVGSDDRWGFLSEDELIRLSRLDPSLELEDKFLSQAFARGDRCFGFVEDGILGAYAWYSVGPTPIQDFLVAAFDPNYIYMHKAFTSPAFRGRRLYGIGVARAMHALAQERRFEGLISCIQSHNQPSLKALRRIGFKTVGRTGVLGRRRPCVSFSTPGCRSLFSAKIQSTETLPMLPQTSHEARQSDTSIRR